MRRSASSRTTNPETVLVAACTVVAALGAGIAGTHPTGSTVPDVLWSAAFGAAVALGASRAHRRSWLVLAGLTMLAVSGPALLAGAVAVVATVVGTTARRRSPPLGAAIGAVSIQALLRLPDRWFHGSTALVVAVAVLPVLISGFRASSPRVRRRLARVAQVGAAGLAIVVLIFGLALLFARSDITNGVESSHDALTAARDGDTARANTRLDVAVHQLGQAERLLNSAAVLPARLVPILGQHAVALGRLSADGADLARAAGTTLDAADYDQMKYEDGQLDLDRIRAARLPLADASEAAAAAERDLARLDRSWLVPPLTDRIDVYREEIATVRSDTSLAAEAAAIAPDLFGGNGTRHYFVAFVTPAEQRGSGGFIGGYGELTATDGRVRLTRSGPIADLILAAPPGARTLTGPPDYLTRYGAFTPQDHFQDVTFSPDFPSDAEVIEQLYPQSGGTRLDGVLQVDPFGLAALLELTGPITVAGIPQPLTSANAAQILLQDQYRIFEALPDAAQNDALAAAARGTFQRLTTGELPSPRKVAQILGPAVHQGRFKFHSVRPDEQRLFDRVGLSWALPRPSGHDLVAVTTQNNANNKIDVYLHRSIDYQVTIDPKTHQIRAKAVVRLENRAPASGLSRQVIGNGQQLPSGTNRLWLSLYSPLSLAGAKLGPSVLPITTTTEGGYSVYGQFLNILPGETLVVTFDLRGSTSRPEDYRLDLVPQPMVNPDRVRVSITDGRAPRAVAGLRIDGDSAIGSFDDGTQRTVAVDFGG